MGSTKIEPRGRAVDPAATADIGVMKGNHSENRDLPFKTRPLFNGQVLEAPMAGVTIHHSGSQGKR